MKTNFTDNLFKKSLDLKASEVAGGLMASCGTSCMVITDGGCDTNTQTYDDDGNRTSNTTTQNINKEGC